MSLADGSAYEKEFGLTPLCHCGAAAEGNCVSCNEAVKDGPEVGIITRIRASYPLYMIGKEGELLKFQRFVDKVAHKMFHRRYGRLGLRRKATVRKMVINLHLDGFRPGSEFLITPSVLEP